MKKRSALSVLFPMVGRSWIVVMAAWIFTAGEGLCIVTGESQTITFSAIENQLTTNTVTLSARASSRLPVSFRVVSGPGVITGSNQLTFSGAGTVFIRASQSGGGLLPEYEAAPSVTRTFTVALTPGITTYADANGGSDANNGLSWATAKQTIQAAINLVGDGGTVWVTNGTYNLTSQISITDNITVQSVNGSEVTIIDGGGTKRCVSMSDGTLTGFTLTHGFSSGGHGAGASLVDGGTLNNCTLSGNVSPAYGGGAYLSSGGTLNNCTLSGNSAAGSGGGASLNGNSTLNNCTLSGNNAGYGGGASLTGDELNNCTLSGNHANQEGGGAYLSMGGTLNNCIAWGNTAGSGNADLEDHWEMGTVRTTCASDGITHGIAGCITSDPRFVSTNDFRLQAGSPCINAGNNSYAPTNATPYDLAGNPRIFEGTVDMGAYEVPAVPVVNDVYVDASVGSSGAGTSWATAMKTIQEGVDAVSTTGTVWVTNGTYALTSELSITNRITVESVNGPDVTILDGGGSSRCVWISNGTLSGLTLTNGYTSEQGGGAYLDIDASLNNCILSGNTALGYGGGVWVNHQCVLNNCVLSGNTANSAGGAMLSNDGVMNNCVLTGNTATEEAGGAYCNSGGTLNNCTMTGNNANTHGGAYLNGAGTLNNCIVWGNTATSGCADIENSGGTIQYSCAADGLTNGVDGCITSDPLFVDVANGNIRLQSDSPCIDAGNDTYAPTGSDLAGNPRIAFGTVDMGAYEIQYQLDVNNGPVAGGNTITLSLDNSSTNITNGYFGSITNVLVGGASAVIIDSGDNWVQFSLPAGSKGAADLVVQTSDNGDITLAGGYTYTAPVIKIAGVNGAQMASDDAASEATGTDFGSVLKGGWIEHTLTISNAGDEALVSRGYSKNGDDLYSFDVSDYPLVVEAGGTANIVFCFDSSEVGSYEAKLSLHYNDDEILFLLNVAGDVYSVSTNNGPAAGGNTITISLENGSTNISSVTIDGETATITGQTSDSVTLIIPAGLTPGPHDIIINGTITFSDAYAVNPAGSIGVVGDLQCAVAASDYHSVGLKTDGSVVAWGLNGYEETTAPAGTDFVAVAAGGNHSLGLKADGSIVEWGNDAYGQATALAGTNFVALAAGLDHSLALKSDGLIFGWGDNDDGQATAPAGTDFIAVAAGGNHSLALKVDGSIVAWGNNDYGQATASAGTNFVAVAAGRFHSLALKSDGSIIGWGRNYEGQTTAPAGTNFVAVTAGGFHSLALKSDGSIVGWGANWNEQTTAPAGTNFVAMAAGDGHSLALKTDGSIVVWGYDINGKMIAPSGITFGFGSGISPERGSCIGGVEVVICGTNLGNGSDITSVTICGVRASVVMQSVDSVTVITGAGIVGIGDVVIESTSFGTTTASNAFTYIKVDQTLDFPNIGNQITTNMVDLSATASSGLSNFTFDVVSGPAVVSGHSVTFTNYGSVVLSATQAGDTNWLAASTNIGFDVSRAISIITLSNTNQVYDGTEKRVSYTIDPPGLGVGWSYPDGIPLNVGTYRVLVMHSGSMYEGRADGTVTIAKADQSVDFPTLGDQITTNQVELVASASSKLKEMNFRVVSGPAVLSVPQSPAAIALSIGVEPPPKPVVTVSFTNSGPVVLSATQVGDKNWNSGSTNISFMVTKAKAAVFLSYTNQIYDGSARVVKAFTKPERQAVEIRYNDSLTAPTDAGQYVVSAVITEAMVQGKASGTLTVSKAKQKITMPKIGTQTVLDTVELSATAESGLPVGFKTKAPGQIADGTNLSFTAAGEVSVSAWQAGSDNWESADGVSSFDVVGVITNVTPNSGTVFGGTEVVIEGLWLGDGTDIISVILCDVEATIITQSMHSVTVRSGKAQPVETTGDVVVKSGFGKVGLADAYTYRPMPLAPTAISAVDITDSQFTARWESTDATTTHYFVDVSGSTNFTDFVGVYSNWNAGPATAGLVTGLVDGESYWYRVRAANDHGSSLDSNMIGVPVSTNTPYIEYEVTNGVASAGSSDVVDLTKLFFGTSMMYEVVFNSNSNLVTASIDGTELMLDYTAGMSGSADITVRVTDSNGFWVENTLTIFVAPAPVPASGLVVLNPQNGLFEQVVTVSNTSPSFAAQAVTLTVTNLSDGASLYNATGSDQYGNPEIQWLGALAPLGTMDFTLQYYTALRGSVPSGEVLVSLSLEEPRNGLFGASFGLSGKYRNINNGSSFLIEFNATPGRTYTIQYATDMSGPWKTVQPSIVAPANRVQWIDSGPPGTECAPGDATKRFYRIIEAAPQEQGDR